MQLDLRLALTLAVSPRRGNHFWPSRERSLISELFQRGKKFSLSWGDGQGEGERWFLLHKDG